MAEHFDLSWPRVQSTALSSGGIKQELSDFQVDELLHFDLSGEGEFLWLYIEKSGHNTAWVATQLARAAHLPFSAVSYSGLKDRQGICKQWFSLHLPGKADPDIRHWQIPGVRCCMAKRHRKKIKRGTHYANAFTIKIRNISESDELSEQLRQIASCGVPNYFGRQRFGHEANNLTQALALFQQGLRLKKAARSLVLSAARSWLFNHMVATRVRLGTWNRLMDGDVLGFPDSGSIILPHKMDASCEQKVIEGQLVPTAALWGEGALLSQGEVAQLEQQIADTWHAFSNGLMQAGLQQQRRATVLLPKNLTWQWHDNALDLTFTLMKGNFATALLHEFLR